MDKKEKEQIADALTAMVQTQGWRYLKEWILKRIIEVNKVSNLKKDTPDEIIRSVLTAQSKADVYKNVLSWVDEKVKNKNEEEDNA